MTRRRPLTDAQRDIIRKVRANPQNTYPMPTDHRRGTVRILIEKGLLQMTACGKRFQISK